ncbi:hypothetical protein WMY93_005531 [Mugilogobius chulae]|uniref:Transmembrane protein 192 n=1 Tax=Mugilogobius chulae TaxID=88201 RepID=A0AAW0PJY1_9GOBI
MDPRESSRHLSEADLTRSMDEDSMVDGPLISADALHSAIRREFQTLPTYTHSALLSVLHVVYVVLSCLVAIMCILREDAVDQCNSVLQSKQRLPEILQTHARSDPSAAFFHSGGNAVLLWILVSKIPQKLRTYLVLAVLVLELLIALPCLIYYTVKVVQFNTERASPDVSHEEHLHNFSVTSLPIETGFREGSNLAEVVDKQADLIEYLKQHNTLLSRRLLNLTAQH